MRAVKSQNELTNPRLIVAPLRVIVLLQRVEQLADIRASFGRSVRRTIKTQDERTGRGAGAGGRQRRGGEACVFAQELRRSHNRERGVESVT